MRQLGVRTRPAYAAGAVVAPILSFHKSWDTEPDITGWRGIPSCERVMNCRACAWPPPLSMLDDSVALRLDALNDAHAAGDAAGADGGAAADVDAGSDPIAIALAMAEASAPPGRRRTSGAPGGAFEASVAALRAEHPSAPLVTFSHFVPRPELSPEKRFLMFPNLAKVPHFGAIRAIPRQERSRSDNAPRRASLRRSARRRCARASTGCANLHVFGHTHFGWDATLDGVRYIQACLAYPPERRQRIRSVAIGDGGASGAPAFPHDASPAPLLVYDSTSGFPTQYDAAWSNFTRATRRRRRSATTCCRRTRRRATDGRGRGRGGLGRRRRPRGRTGPPTPSRSRRRKSRRVARFVYLDVHSKLRVLAIQSSE